MKKIQSVPIWKDGQVQSATWLNSLCINDNLKDTAIFYYTLNADYEGLPNEILADGNLTMNGVDYQNWNDNDYAYNWIATQLSLTIIQ